MDFPSIVRYLTCTEPSVGFPGGSEVKASACNAGDLGSIPGLQRFPGEGNGNPPQYSCLENAVDGGAWWATIHGVAKSRTRLNDFTFTFKHSMEKAMAPHSSTLAGKSHGQRSLVGCSLWGCEGRTGLSNFTSTLHFHELEKEMATHSSVLAWRIPGTEEPRRLPSMGSHRVGHDWSDLAAASIQWAFLVALLVKNLPAL